MKLICQNYWIRSNFNKQIRFCHSHRIKALKSDIAALKKKFQFDSLSVRISHLKSELENSKIWENSRLAAQYASEMSKLESDFNDFSQLDNSIQEAEDFYELALSEYDVEAQNDVGISLENIDRIVSEKIMSILFNDDQDNLDCYIQVNAGAGGTESCDWAMMLFKMYQAWAKPPNFSITIVDKTEDADSGGGFRGITARISGFRAYGWMKNEAGVHRLVRISPFDPQHKRHTSFAQVLVYPSFSSSDMDKNPSSSIELRTSDLKIEFMRSRGPGGQHANKTESAVRITHISTGMSVSCQNERSQHLNKAVALSMLKSRIWLHEKEERQKVKESLTIGQGSNSWGHQIRSLVLQPYTLVKDHRSSWETANTDAYLNGDLIGNCMHAHLVHASSLPPMTHLMKK